CKIKRQVYYLTNLTKHHNNCDACDNSNVKDSMPVLVHSDGMQNIGIGNSEIVLNHHNNNFYTIKINKPGEKVLSLIQNTRIDAIDPDHIIIDPKTHIVCFSEITTPNTETDYNKIYTDNSDLQKDKVKFHLYFNINGAKK